MVNINDFIIRVLDIILSALGIIILSPIIIIFIILIYLKDFHSPFYIAERVGLNGKTFKMFKLRSMIINADKTGVDSTPSDDDRITKIGLLIRKYKIDEIPQLINVFMGNMSLVCPRPNVLRETNLYTKKDLVTIREELKNVKQEVNEYSVPDVKLPSKIMRFADKMIDSIKRVNLTRRKV